MILCQGFFSLRAVAYFRMCIKSAKYIMGYRHNYRINANDRYDINTYYGETGRRSYQNVVIGLRREFRYGVTTADEGLRPISPSKLKYPPHPSGRRYQTNQETLFSLVMFI